MLIESLCNKSTIKKTQEIRIFFYLGLEKLKKYKVYDICIEIILVQSLDIILKSIYLIEI